MVGKANSQAKITYFQKIADDYEAYICHVKRELTVYIYIHTYIHTYIHKT
jgi:hypothetical protein